MTDTWRKLDEEVAATPMPDIYLQKMVINTTALPPFPTFRLNAADRTLPPACRYGSSATTAARRRTCGSTSWATSAPAAAPTTLRRRGAARRPQRRAPEFEQSDEFRLLVGWIFSAVPGA
jgi:hypothetical protein